MAGRVSQSCPKFLLPIPPPLEMGGLRFARQLATGQESGERVTGGIFLPWLSWQGTCLDVCGMHTQWEECCWGVGVGQGAGPSRATSATSCHSALGTLLLCASDTPSKLYPRAWSDLPPVFQVTVCPGLSCPVGTPGPDQGPEGEFGSARVRLYSRLYFYS